jgi:hypothetical protein
VKVGSDRARLGYVVFPIYFPVFKFGSESAHMKDINSSDSINAYCIRGLFAAVFFMCGVCCSISTTSDVITCTFF